MYATTYLTEHGFASVGFIGDFIGDRIRVADPVFGWAEPLADDCFAVTHTETGYVLPGVRPALSPSLTSPWLLESERLAANKVIRGPWGERDVREHPKTMLEPELGGDKFVSGYPHAWERIQRWAFEVAPDWRSLALSAIFARCSIQRPIEEAERLYRMFGPTLRDAMLRGKPPSPEQMLRWRGIKGTRAEKRKGGLDDLRSFQEIMEWAPWCSEVLASRDDLSRDMRDIIALEFLPWGLGIAKLSFTMMLSGRDAACLDTRMLNYFLAGTDPYATDFNSDEEDEFLAVLEIAEERGTGGRKLTPKQIATRLELPIESVQRYLDLSKNSAKAHFLSKVSRRQKSKVRVVRGMQRSAVEAYRELEGQLKQTPYFDPDWPQPYAKAQWMLWETIGRTAGTADHGALWEVIDPLIEEITGKPLARNPGPEAHSLDDFYQMGRANADMAIDQAHEYESVYDALMMYWDNVADTALEWGARRNSDEWNAADRGFMELAKPYFDERERARSGT